MTSRSQITHMIATAMAVGVRPPEVTERQWDIVRLRADGWSEEAVANEIGATPEVAQLEERMAMAALVARARTVAEVTG